MHRLAQVHAHVSITYTIYVYVALFHTHDRGGNATQHERTHIRTHAPAPPPLPPPPPRRVNLTASCSGVEFRRARTFIDRNVPRPIHRVRARLKEATLTVRSK